MITPIAVIGWVAAGGASAFGGWIFHKFVKSKAALHNLELRVTSLEKLQAKR